MEEWSKLLDGVEVSKEHLDAVVLNFLAVEGYKDAAESFQRESGLSTEIDLGAMQHRMDIRSAVQHGDVATAIARVNELNPAVLEDERISFHLQQQQLIELIRAGKLEDALAFAQAELAPRCADNEAFLGEMEQTMALLAFEDFTKCPANELLDAGQRQRTAGELNTAILAGEQNEQESRLPALLKLMTWLQKELAARATVPTIHDYVHPTLVGPSSSK